MEVLYRKASLQERQLYKSYSASRFHRTLVSQNELAEIERDTIARTENLTLSFGYQSEPLSLPQPISLGMYPTYTVDAVGKQFLITTERFLDKAKKNQQVREFISLSRNKYE